MAGYSKNPLWKKLGIKDHFDCLLFQSPKNYFDLLEAIPENSHFDNEAKKTSYDFIHVFITEYEELALNWDTWKDHLKKDGSLWVSWPKGGSKMETNVNGNIIRAYGIDGGLVDVKVCAVDADWSGLKFMYRRKDR